MSDKIVEIRARHEDVEMTGNFSASDKQDAHNDRAFLLNEIERLTVTVDVLFFFFRILTSILIGTVFSLIMFVTFKFLNISYYEFWGIFVGICSGLLFWVETRKWEKKL